MKNTKTVAALALATALCTLGASVWAQDLRVTVWTGSDAHLSMLNGIADGFEEANPGTTVTFETIPFSEYTQKLTLQLAGGNPPDVGWLLESDAPTFTAAGVLADIGPALRADNDYDFDDFADPAMGLWVDGVAVYGIPFSTSPFMLYYNATAFDEAGLATPNALAAEGNWTWETLREAAAVLANGDGFWGFEGKDGQGYDSRIMHSMMPVIRAYGGDAWTNGECGFTSPEAIAAMEHYHAMIFEDQSVVPPGEIGDFFAGDAAMTINQISRVTRLADADFEWGIAPLPTGPGGTADVIGQAALVVFEQGENRDLATQLIAHITSVEGVATMAQFFPPARASVLASDAFTQSNDAIAPEQMELVKAAIEGGTVLPAHERYPQIFAAMSPRVDALWQPDADVGAVMASVCDAIAGDL
ncbi:MAG: ABC transporter substrate-binding protein [Hyphomicrobiales bacterium]